LAPAAYLVSVHIKGL